MSRATRIVCADWGGPSNKRTAYEALVGERVIRRVPAADAWEVESLLEYARRGDRPTLLAFDAPIGVPRSFIEAARKSGLGPSISGFLDWLSLATFDECEDAAHWSIASPFFRVPPKGGEGSLRAFEAAARKAGVDLYRAIEKQTGGKTAFMTSGVPGSVGSAARDIWMGLAAARKKKAPFSVWPFEGDSDPLVASVGPVVAEIYPRAAYATALLDQAPRPRLFVAKADKKKLPKQMQSRTRHDAVECLLATEWPQRAGVRFENVAEARANEDDFDALMTAAALLRCLVEGLPLLSPAFIDPLSEGAILGTGSIDLALPEENFERRFGVTRARVARAGMRGEEVTTAASSSASGSRESTQNATSTDLPKGIGCYCGCPAPTKSHFASGHDRYIEVWLLERGVPHEEIKAHTRAALAVRYGFAPKKGRG